MERACAFLASCLLLACGSVKDGKSRVDADPGPDADLSADATVSTKAAVTGQTASAVVADVDLISTLPNGDVLATGKTDASGNATIKVYPGGAVTAVYRHTGTSLGADLFTIVGVKPGENLEFGQKTLPFVGTSTAIGSQTYSWPASPNGAVTLYRVQTSCTSTSVAAPTTSVALPESSSCNKGAMRILYTATTPNPTTLANCGVRAVTFADTATVALSSWSNSVLGSGNISGLSASATSLSVSLRAVVGGTTELSLSGGGSANGVLTGGAFTGNFQWCPNLGERTVARVSLNRSSFGGITVMDSLPASATSVTVSSPLLPPWVEGTFLTSAYKRSASWVLANDGTNAHDAVYLQLSFAQQIDTMTFGARWHLLLPPDTQSIELPRLPAAFDNFQPTTDFGMSLNRLVAIEVPTVSDYDGLRAMGIGFAICPDCAIRANEVPRVIISGF
jgi:hypothetical protein